MLRLAVRDGRIFRRTEWILLGGGGSKWDKKKSVWLTHIMVQPDLDELLFVVSSPWIIYECLKEHHEFRATIRLATRSDMLKGNIPTDDGPVGLTCDTGVLSSLLIIATDLYTYSPEWW